MRDLDTCPSQLLSKSYTLLTCSQPCPLLPPAIFSPYPSSFLSLPHSPRSLVPPPPLLLPSSLLPPASFLFSPPSSSLIPFPSSSILHLPSPSILPFIWLPPGFKGDSRLVGLDVCANQSGTGDVVVALTDTGRLHVCEHAHMMLATGS